ncbi:sirohydrochlorin ferrochelatase [Microbacterium resistens]|uniref:Sirohydrochlorin ferrochelatase n=1 Tax=Microbacterium resistens TaxID=156977 RepID=A0ABU1SGQ8_9MICO|nr:CbiX/SirB N-terminal domain-containing protein [Microbacterium resistens]MDR6868797.1 sirohydrochlorin ferrochelatase [Microbacterium resistens]
MPRPTLLAVSHGTSDVDGAHAIARFVDRIAAALPDVDVRAAFVDVQQPDVRDELPTIAGPVVIVPLLLSSGFHVHHDLHGSARERPDAVVADTMGPDARLAEVLAERLPPVLAGPVILAVAGSRDPRSSADAEDMAALLQERLSRPVSPAYLAARRPDLPTALATDPEAVVATYLLACGYFFDLAARQAHDRTIALPLLDGGPVPRELVDLIVARYEDAVMRMG